MNHLDFIWYTFLGTFSYLNYFLQCVFFSFFHQTKQRELLQMAIKSCSQHSFSLKWDPCTAHFFDYTNNMMSWVAETLGYLTPKTSVSVQSNLYSELLANGYQRNTNDHNPNIISLVMLKQYFTIIFKVKLSWLNQETNKREASIHI
jgi:hypothetical protein